MSTLRQRIATFFGRPSGGTTATVSSSVPAAAKAEGELTRQRDEALRALERAALLSGAFSPDYTAESLRALDAWYRDLWQRDAFLEVGSGRAEFERWMALYFGEVAVRNNADARWTVVPHPAGRGRFDLGVRRGEDVMLTSDAFRDHYKTFMLTQRPRQSVYRTYRDEWK
jgi:hypothetical protein